MANTTQLNAVHSAYQVGSMLYDWNGCGYGVNSPAVPEVFSYWVLSDYFDEDGIFDMDFINTHGMITRKNSIKKPIWNAYKAMHMLGDRMLPMTHSSPSSNDKGIASFDSKNKMVGVMLYNCPEADVTVFNENQIQLSITNLSKLWGTTDSLLYRRYLIDKDHSNAFTIWQNFGKPESMKPEEVAACKKGQELACVDSIVQPLTKSGIFEKTLTQPGQSLTLVTLAPWKNGTFTIEGDARSAGRLLKNRAVMLRYLVGGVDMVPVELRGVVSHIEIFELTGRKVFAGAVDRNGRIIRSIASGQFPRQLYVVRFQGKDK
jgi:hypothetical protein